VTNQKLRDVIELHALTMPPTAATAAQLADRAAAMADAAQFYAQVINDVALPDDFVSSTADDIFEGDFFFYSFTPAVWPSRAFGRCRIRSS
jgi:hypothetical protein